MGMYARLMVHYFSWISIDDSINELPGKYVSKGSSTDSLLDVVQLSSEHLRYPKVRGYEVKMFLSLEASDISP